MGKKKGNAKGPEYLSRPQRRGAPGPSPLVLLAGFPKDTASIIARTINNDGKLPWRAVSSRFSPHDDAVYADPEAALALGRAACGISREEQTDAEGVPMPSRIAIAYIADTPGFGELWKVMGHSVWPLPLRHHDWTYPHGRHWRHEVATSVQVIRKALVSTEHKDIDAWRLRLEAQRLQDALLLPGRNFHLPDDQRLIGRFRAFMNGSLDIGDIETGVRLERFPFERLRKFYSATGGKNKTFAVDERNLVFPRSNAGQHGGDAFQTLPDKPAAEMLQRALEARYRFGTPFSHKGFQHDVQWSDDKQLNSERFDCSTKGPVELSGSHVNVFPSDVVTGDLTEIK